MTYAAIEQQAAPVPFRCRLFAATALFAMDLEAEIPPKLIHHVELTESDPTSLKEVVSRGRGRRVPGRR
jgi:hypothetical protein